MQINDVTGRPNSPQCEHGNWNGCIICRPGLKLPKGENVSPTGMVKRLQNRTGFEDYLVGRFTQKYTGTKDSYENDLDRWMSELDVQEVIDYAEQWADSLLEGKVVMTDSDFREVADKLSTNDPNL